MTTTEATAEVFLTALKAMPKTQRSAVLARIAQDKALRQDLLDLAVIEQNRGDDPVPLRDLLAGKSSQ